MDIFVQSKTDIVTSKNNRKYFTLENEQGKKFICYNTSLFNLFEVGGTVVNVQVEEKEGQTTKIVGVGESKIEEAEKIVKIDDSTYRSVKQQNRVTALANAVQLASVGVIELTAIKSFAVKFAEYLDGD